ncbi:FAD-dependent oxidoreductase [Pseudomonas sp. CCC3.1]|uniref:FAD-dependent oxidoreductase n=1 Tax=Pseudomonas sp. CCC3.1 TaxID=3048607 RepID=UPI002AC99D8C|nr:FAD-dependent oxidoreductase [Pseudomonas sp. CCC3.1]MEB0205200.1 FAD-dependent oxidoreductase [Pseudomonas sp. CCC3.1]WPX38409.1 FAD-dependent oxidoreductase [Pseudomonas sp. CCC3.1]
MNRVCDVLVIGAGAGGLSTAIVAKKAGLDVIVIEKADFFGGTTAFSGGVLWIPDNHLGKAQNSGDSLDLARTYLRAEAGKHYDAPAVEAFLENGPKMVEFFERETCVKFVPTLYPDYHPDAPGGLAIGRSILAAPFDIRELGADMKRLRPPLKTITFIGMMFNSSNADLKHFFNATRSLTSFIYVAKRLGTHMREMMMYRRGTQVTSGNALAARLAKSALDLGIPIVTGVAARQLLKEKGCVTGVLASGAQGEFRIDARRGVVLASGGFSHDTQRLREAYPHVKRGGEHFSPVPDSNTGDSLRMAEAVGGQVDICLQAAAAWMPVSKVPTGDGEFTAFPHLLDRYKPGIIGVDVAGRRFTNESNSYHDVGEAMINNDVTRSQTAMWLVCDARTLGKYGLGFAKPSPMPLGTLLRNGYLLKGRTLAELALKAGIDGPGLEQTVERYNQGASVGKDVEFGRGTTAFNRFLADPQHKPNPCVAPIGAGPYYAVKLVMGDLGTFDGLRTSTVGEVLDQKNSPIPGLYAVGNDRASIMGGNYPGAGITLGPIMTFGFITGRHLAKTSLGTENTEQEQVA